MKEAIVHVTSVKVTCPECRQDYKWMGSTYRFPVEWSDEWDKLRADRHFACPLCKVVIQWPANPFKRPLKPGGDHVQE